MTTTTRPDARPESPAVLRLAARALRFELNTWRCLVRWVTRRPDVPADGVAFAYRGPMALPIAVITALSVLETVVVDIAVPWPWQWLRFTFLALGIWGVTLMLGLLAAVTVLPHVAGPAGLRVRHGHSLDAHVPWDAVAAARVTRGSRDGRSVQVADGVLYMLATSQYAVEVRLGRPVTVRLPGDRHAEVTAVRLHTDDPAALVAEVRSRAGQSNSSC